MKIEKVQMLCDQLDGMGYELIATHQLQHEDDRYMLVVLARRDRDGSYSTWLYNSACNVPTGLLFWAHLGMTLEDAKADFANRIPKSS